MYAFNIILTPHLTCSGCLRLAIDKMLQALVAAAFTWHMNALSSPDEVPQREELILITLASH